MCPVHVSADKFSLWLLYPLWNTPGNFLLFWLSRLGYGHHTHIHPPFGGHMSCVSVSVLGVSASAHLALTSTRTLVSARICCPRVQSHTAPLSRHTSCDGVCVLGVSASAVSYTHLDVYKRQSLYSALLIKSWRFLKISATICSYLLTVSF